MSRSFLRLQDGTQVQLFDSEGSPGREKEWVSLIEGSRQSAIVKTSEGDFRCWVDGRPAGDGSDSRERALEEMDRLLGATSRRPGVRPCPGVGTYVSDAVTSTAGVHKVTICHACEEYVAVEDNRIAFHSMF